MAKWQTGLPALAVGVLTLWLPTGCGGGGVTPMDPDSVTPAAREEAMDAVAARLDALPVGTPAADAIAAAARTMAGRPEFEATGASPEAGTAWGRFPGGTLYIVDVSGRPRPESDASALEAGIRDESPARTGIPRGPAVLCHVLDPMYTNVAAVLSPWLTAAGYSVTANPTAAGGVADLKKVKGAALFYMGTHGVWSPVIDSAAGPWAALTATVPTLTNQVTYAADLEDHSLAIVDAYFREGHLRRYAFTAGFVRKYMTFAPDSLVYMDACRSDHACASSFRDACFDAGASLYAGWSEVVSDTACAESTPFLFCRMLGAAAPDGNDQNPPRRPFDYGDGLADLKLRGWNLDQYHINAELSVTEGPGDGAWLRPSIECLRVNEAPTGAASGQSELVVRGNFGPDPGEGPFHAARSVSCGGEELSLISWQPDEIHASLPVSGPGSAGDVVVTVQGVASNAVPLTEWWVTVLYRDAAAPGSGETVFSEVAVNCHLRYDIHGWRETPAGDIRFTLPDPQEQPTPLARDSYGSFRCGGERPVYHPETGELTYKVIYGGAGSLAFMAEDLGSGCWGSSQLRYEYTGGPAPVLSLRCAVLARSYPFGSHILWVDGHISNEETHSGEMGPLEFDLAIGEGGVIEAGEAGNLSWQRTLPRFQPTAATPRSR